MRKRYASVAGTSKECWHWYASSIPLQTWAVDITHSELYAIVQQVIPSSGSILDVGCGPGQWVLHYGAKGYQTFGIDNTLEVLLVAKQDCPSLSLGCADGICLPFAHQTFDVCFSFGVVEHDENGPLQALVEMHRVLSPNGMLILTVPYYNMVRQFEDRLSRLFSCFFPEIRAFAAIDQGQFFEYWFTKQEISTFVTNAGYEVLMTRPISLYWGLRTLRLVRWARGKLRSKRNPKGSRVTVKSKQHSLTTERVMIRLGRWLAHRFYWICPHMIAVVARPKEPPTQRTWIDCSAK